MFDILRSATPPEESFLLPGWSEFAIGNARKPRAGQPRKDSENEVKIKLDMKMKLR
jgi:hypothetical protein